jgi:hypothetical protein
MPPTRGGGAVTTFQVGQVHPCATPGEVPGRGLIGGPREVGREAD